MTTDWGDLAFDAQGQLVDVTQERDPGPPPDMTWTQLELYALTAEKIFGRVVALSNHQGVEYNLVVVSDTFTDEAGVWVRVVTNECFRLWGKLPEDQRPPAPTPARAVPAKHVWVLHDKVPEGRNQQHGLDTKSGR